MNISTLIRKLEEEKAKYGDIEIVLHTGTRKAQGEILDVATFHSSTGNQLWLSTEPAE
jgi:hypothetical protein